MIAFNDASLVVLALGCLVLNYFALRNDARSAGHGRSTMIRMALIWGSIIAALVLFIKLYQS